MSSRTAIAPACTAVAAVLVDPGEVDLSGPTPCDDFDLRALVEHVVGTSGAMARVGLGEPLDPDHPWGGGEGAADGDWSAALRRNLEAVAEGWSREQAWEGDVEVGGSTWPRSMIGEMALVEVVLHGWDLGRSLGRRLDLPEDVAADALRSATSTAEMGRSMGAYGPEVEVGEDASTLDRVLGVTGRDPGWRT